jgi:hypothetical protein
MRSRWNWAGAWLAAMALAAGAHAAPRSGDLILAGASAPDLSANYNI